MRRRTGQPTGKGGSVTVIQRFGSALNLNLHFHALVLDGVYTQDPATGRVRWHRAPAPTDEEDAGVVIGAKDRRGLERLCRYIARPPLAKPRLEERPDGSSYEDGAEQGPDWSPRPGSPRTRPPRPGGCHGPGCCGEPRAAVEQVDSWAWPRCDQRMRLEPS